MKKVRRSALVAGVVCALIGGGALIGDAGAQPGDAVAPAASSLVPAAVGDPSTLVSLTPTRIVDTRINIGGIVGPIAPDTTVDFQVAGLAGVPAQATSVVLNVTAVDPDATGYFTLFATGTARPEVSNLNVVAGQNVANLVIARVGNAGKVSLYNFGGRAQVIFDVTGYFVNGTGAGRYNNSVPIRLLDTRSPRRTPAPNQSIAVPVANQLPEVSHYASVLVNVTVTAPLADGYLTVYPTGEPVPTSSNVNFKAGQTVANAVIVKVGRLTTQGWSSISVFNALAVTDVIVDLIGVFDDGTIPTGFSTPTAFRALDQPVRAYNTRITDGPFGPQETRTIKMNGFGDAPPGALGVVFNATATATSAGSFLTMYSPIFPRPTVSSLNWAPGDTVPNFVGAFIPGGGASTGLLSIYNDAGTADVLLDITGYFYPV